MKKTLFWIATIAIIFLLAPGIEIVELLAAGENEVSMLDIENVIALSGEQANDLFSSKRRISFSGDTYGDGIFDLLIWAPGWDRDPRGTGAVYWIFGALNIGSTNRLSHSDQNS
jgi:hypothetical protein